MFAYEVEAVHYFDTLVLTRETQPLDALAQCFSTAGPRPGTGPWHELYRTARGSPGICHCSFLSNFHE